MLLCLYLLRSLVRSVVITDATGVSSGITPPPVKTDCFQLPWLCHYLQDF